MRQDENATGFLADALQGWCVVQSLSLGPALVLVMFRVQTTIFVHSLRTHYYLWALF